MKKSLVYGTIAIALIAALAVGIPAAVSANTSDTVSAETSATTTVDEQQPGAEFTARVAEILNIDEDTVSDAFQQATQEIMAERQQERLQNAVDNGLITEEEATEIQAWMDSRPEALENLGQGWLNSLMRPSGNFFTNVNPDQGVPPDMGREFPGMRPSDNSSSSKPANMGNMPGGSTLSTEEYLQNAVDSGTITQAEADEITTWINAMPDALDKIGPLGGPGQSMGRGRMMGQDEPYAFCAP